MSNHTKRTTFTSVDVSTPCKSPEREVIRGKHVELRPWVDEHAEKLHPHVSGPKGDSIWDFIVVGPFAKSEDFRAVWHEYTTTTDPIIWTVFDLKSGEAGGSVALSCMSTENRIIEIGVLFAPFLQRTVASTEAWYLGAKKVFELGFRRMEWRCDAANSASRRSAVRYGHTFEGVLRQHQIVKGYNRDTALYSILDKEWPEHKLAIETWMSDENFDGEGTQKKSLATIRKELEQGS